MNNDDQRQKALAFRRLHHGPRILLLPNIWDVASARVVAQCRYPALATTSAGVAFSLGYPDGENISRDEMLARVAAIAERVDLPVTADVEAGYGQRPEDAALTAQGVIEAGAVGMNLEDGTGDPEHPLADLSLQVERIRAVRETAHKSAFPLVLNARTDVYLTPIGEPGRRYAVALQRALAYRDAGADCVFVPGLDDLENIAQLVKDVKYPVNILAGYGSPSALDLEKAGVARLSLGSGPMRATLGLLRRLAEELKSVGTYSRMDGAPPHAEVNRMLGK
ncbi:MAG: isocitrate lyase/phosphoenolpyruvate mutase family protein [Acidobacteria bacterium]|nr:isocitrate lyase/phosphoenolpyruvate mutase family protein [Acidobacteriota bacterium]